MKPKLLKVVETHPKLGRIGLFVCVCGKRFRRLITLTRKQFSCGCLRIRNVLKAIRRHGHTTANSCTRTYRSWYQMKQRCLNKKDGGFFRYGGRGIKVCSRWKTFKNFLTDMGVRPVGKSLDRIDTNGHYTLANCRWATVLQQARNRNPRGTHI